jgi:TolB-like protein/Tfp pilus assembly protein PilF
MTTLAAPPRILRFGVFEADLESRELRKRGLRMKIQQKPFQFLELLLERPGELVTRKQIAERLWPGVYVTFDRSLNTAVNALRRALSDSPRNPRFLETRQGLGYRFIAPVEKAGAASVEPPLGDSIDSIAVLPFQSAASDPALNSLSDGIAERIIGTLSTAKSLRIVSRSTAFRYRERDVDAAAVGKELNVRAVLAGRVARHGDSFSVSAELVETRTGLRLWGEQYDRSAAGLASIERDIARDIARKLRLHWNGKQHGNAEADREAYRDYLKGRYFYNKMTEDALRKSVAYFEAALAAEPDYALAHAGLADTYCLFAFLDIMPSSEALARAKQLALAAVHIDGDLAEAHAALANVKMVYEWDWAGAESEYRAALELNPEFASAHHWYADHLSAMGRPDEALIQIQRAQELDPLSLVISNEAAWNLYMARDYQGALEQAWRTLALEPRFAPAQHTLGLANEQLGNQEEAAVEFENAYVCSGNQPAALASLAHAHAGAGQKDEARKLLRDIEETSHRRHVSPYWLSIVYTALEDYDTAFALLSKGIEERDVWMVWLKVEPRFDPLRPDPRFDSLLRTIHL